MNAYLLLSHRGERERWSRISVVIKEEVNEPKPRKVSHIGCSISAVLE